jgi:Sec-independent protein translocase protein TatA
MRSKDASFGWQQSILILVISIVLFGAGRITKIAGELGGGICAFFEGTGSNDGDATQDHAETKNE